MDRTITFTMPSNPNILVKGSETNDGKLLFDLNVLGKADLRGLFFDVKPTNLIKNLQVQGANITDQAFADEGVTNLKGGVNINGSKSKFDVGIAFGSPGKGKDLIQKTSFTLSTNNNKTLTLDDIANTEFGVRLTSKGSKETLIAPAAPDAINDAIQTDEDTPTDETEPNKNLLANDTDADGDKLTIFAVNGNQTQVGNPFTLPTGGIVTVGSDGTFDLNPNGQYDDLAVGETRTDSFTYRITDELLDPKNQGFDTAIANIKIIGVNDPPIISVNLGDSKAETLVETNTTINTAKTITVSDVDKTDVVKASVIAVETGGNNSDPSIPNQASLLSMLKVDPNPILDETQTSTSLNWSFNSNGQAFNYLADDENLVLTYTIQAQDDNGASDTEIITITVDGTNDQPIAKEVSLAIGEDDPSQTSKFIASDVDTSDKLSFKILAQPTDKLGHQYGKVTNNNGTFTFDPLDNFQFLDAGESREVTFSYVAVDDSGTVNNTSEPKTVTVKVNGADDAPKDLTDQLKFQSNDQSMFGTGPAVTIEPNLDFLGISWNNSFDKTLIEGRDFGAFGVDFFSTPAVSLNGATSGRVGVQPYFSLTSGDVDSSIPVDVKFIVPHQVEEGETFNIASQLSINGATFNTQSPSVEFGLDLIFKVAANANVNVSSSSFGDGGSWTLFNFNPDEFVKNLFSFSSADNLEYEVEFPLNLGSLNVNFPDIATTGTQIDGKTLTSEGNDSILESNLDLDALVTYFSGIPFGTSYSKNLFGDAVQLSASIDFIDADLIGTLSAIQDFKLDIKDLPLTLTLEDGTDITGVSVGDSLSITAPSNFDPDTGGDKDGLIDFDVNIDMDAVFQNMTGLGFDLDLFLGIMKATAGLKIDIPKIGNVVDKTFNLFPTSNGFLISNTYDLLSTEVNIFNDKFDLEGFNQETFAGAFDVA
jgi:VCBS repeat-containing protein